MKKAIFLIISFISLTINAQEQPIQPMHFLLFDGKAWLKIENSAEVSSFNHNALSGFMSLRLGLTSVGEGSVTFRNFVYSAVK